MDKLFEARVKIDKIDHEMVQLFEKRMEIVREVVDYKIENNLPILDSKRENEIIITNARYLNNDFYYPYYETWMNAMFVSSKAMQKKILNHKK